MRVVKVPPPPAGRPARAGSCGTAIDRRRVHLASLLAAKAEQTDSLPEAIALTEKARTLLDRALPGTGCAGAGSGERRPPAAPRRGQRSQSRRPATTGPRRQPAGGDADAALAYRSASAGDGRGRLLDCRL